MSSSREPGGGGEVAGKSILTDSKLKKADSKDGGTKKRVSVSSTGEGHSNGAGFRRHSGSLTSIDRSTGTPSLFSRAVSRGSTASCSGRVLYHGKSRCLLSSQVLAESAMVVVYSSASFPSAHACAVDRRRQREREIAEGGSDSSCRASEAETLLQSQQQGKLARFNQRRLPRSTHRRL